MARSARAKVFWSGGSQAIRVPKVLRLSSDEVDIERRGNALLVTPVPKASSMGDFWQRLLPLKGRVRRWKTRAVEKRKPL
ncbi:MAG TPA: hypothetical protein VGI10_02385 [Polyangiaceae bacterium]|jgi:antitoxin VapB